MLAEHNYAQFWFYVKSPCRHFSYIQDSIRTAFNESDLPEIAKEVLDDKI